MTPSQVTEIARQVKLARGMILPPSTYRALNRIAITDTSRGARTWNGYTIKEHHLVPNDWIVFTDAKGDVIAAYDYAKGLAPQPQP